MATIEELRDAALAAREGEPEGVKSLRWIDNCDLGPEDEIKIVKHEATEAIAHIDTLTARLDAVTRERDALRERGRDV